MAEPFDWSECSSCRTLKTAAEFKTKTDGSRAKTCLVCQRRTRELAQARKAAADKENSAPNPDADEEAHHGRGLGVLLLDDFLDALTQQEDNLELEACINISSISGERRVKADQLKAHIWNRMKYHSKYDHHRTESTRFMYHCAQTKTRQNGPKKTTREGVKHRDKLAMDAFECGGWLHITINDWDDIAFVKIVHHDDHVPYWSIDVPADVADFVRHNPQLTPGQLWSEILKTHPQPTFTRRAIYAMWAETNAMEWKRDPDELKSANILLQEFTSPDPKIHCHLSFALPKILREVGGRDWSEINAFLAKYPNAKHQLCFWHALRAIKTRLAILRRVPAHYAVESAHAEFNWIDEKFVPVSQSQEVAPNTYVAAQAIPQLTLRLRGVPMATAPRPMDAQPSLTLRLNGAVRAVIPRPNYNDSEPTTGDVDEEEGDLLEEVDKLLDKDSAMEQDQEDGPDWMFEAGETKSADPEYVFCPAPHRKPLLRLFTKHFCQTLSSLLPMI
ncbi:hypothetical protein C8J57DRAFT_1539110 [Mycena rebaudengoi]|nr:hypothetical protein C8J57DRAFT_1539110 [Mycena rebaudengoi]